MPDSADNGFINPFTFLPWPQVDATTFRRAPAGHARLGPDRLLGSIEVTVTARSPLLVRDKEERFPRRRLPDQPELVPFLPGSGLAGAFRSVHEALVGGCLRVFDPDVLPSYRDEPNPRGQGWQLAQVVEVTANGCPKRLQLCSRYDKVSVDLLAQVLGGAEKIETGARVSVIQPRKTKGAAKPRKITDAKWLGSGDECVVLMTDAGARDTSKPYLCAVGRLSDSELFWGSEEEFTRGWSDAWNTLVALINDTEDMRLARSDQQSELHSPKHGPVSVPVYFPPEGEQATKIGHRHAARPVLCPGQVLWVLPRPDRAGVQEFALAQVWRHRGHGHSGDRVPAVLRSCSEPMRLCPTCRVWGSTSETAGTDGEARQHSYRGHLRFSDGVPVGDPPVTVSTTLPPLGTPRPGAGQFYLEPSQPRRRTDTERPLREWGSSADDGQQRLLRGRKQYWLTGESKRRPFFRLKPGELDDEHAMVTEAEYVPRGSAFRFTVWFENLDKAELGGLLATLDPSAVLTPAKPHKRIGVAVGGGKPLGFGTCVTEITGLTVHRAHSWYADDEQPPEDTVDSYVEAFRNAVELGVRATWPALAAAWTLDRVPPRQVWYPTARALPSGELTAHDLEPGFDSFWAVSADLPEDRVLPHVLAEDQTLPLAESEAKKESNPPPPRHTRKNRTNR